MTSTLSLSRRIEQAELWPVVLSLPFALACATLLQVAARPSAELEWRSLRIEGSSTGFPMLSVLAARFQSQHEPAARVAVSGRGSATGMARLLARELDVCVTSRPMHELEFEKLKAQGRRVLELPLALDGIALGLSSKNDFVDELSPIEVQQIFRGNSPARRWSELRSSWPNSKIEIYAPGPGSGTLELFREAFGGLGLELRTDLRFQENDEVSADAVGASSAALGIFSRAQLRTHARALRQVPLRGPGGGPLDELFSAQRALWLTLDLERLEAKPLLEAFLQFVLVEMDSLSPEFGFQPLGAELVALLRRSLHERWEKTRLYAPWLDPEQIYENLRERLDQASKVRPKEGQ